jgi:hypothetical protein
VADRIPRPSISLPRWRSTTKSAKPEPAPPRKAPRIILPNDPGSFLANAASVVGCRARWRAVDRHDPACNVDCQPIRTRMGSRRGWHIGACGFGRWVRMATYLELAGFRRLREAAAFQKQFTENGPPEPLEKQQEALGSLMNALPVPVEIVALVTNELDGIDEGSAEHSSSSASSKTSPPSMAVLLSIPQPSRIVGACPPTTPSLHAPGYV